MIRSDCKKLVPVTVVRFSTLGTWEYSSRGPKLACDDRLLGKYNEGTDICYTRYSNRKHSTRTSMNSMELLYLIYDVTYWSWWDRWWKFNRVWITSRCSGVVENSDFWAQKQRGQKKLVKNSVCFSKGEVMMHQILVKFSHSRENLEKHKISCLLSVNIVQRGGTFFKAADQRDKGGWLFSLSK